MIGVDLQIKWIKEHYFFLLILLIYPNHGSDKINAQNQFQNRLLFFPLKD